MSELDVRRYRPADADAVRRLHRRALRDAGTDPDDLPDTSDLADPLAHYVEAGGEFLVGERDGRIVAMGGLRPVDGSTAELKRMRVAPDAQRQGYGRATLEALESAARERGLDRLVLDTAARQDAAPFYRANGYRETGRRRWRAFELIDLEKEF